MENDPTGARHAAPVRRSAEEWREILCDFEASGEAAKSYCATRGLSRKTFSKWRSQLNNTVSAPAFVAVHPPEPSPTGWDMELELGNGLVLRLKRR